MKCGWLCAAVWMLGATAIAQKASPPNFNYDEARKHELKPHRRNIPAEGATGGFNQLHLSLTISPLGDVIAAEAGEDKDSLRFWPKVQGEVWQWKFRPFEVNGHSVMAKIEEYADIVPPERRPAVHMTPLEVKPHSNVEITLQRTGCFGSCPSYTVTLSTSGIVFDGGGFVVAQGRHVAAIDADQVRALAKEFVAADFYSMDKEYHASVTDNPTYILSISIDGKSKRVSDYVGTWVGMPGVISELEDEVDELAHTGQWIEGSEGLVSRLKDERYDFGTFDAQVMLKQAAQNGQAQTVSELLAAGVGLKPLPAPKLKEPYMGVPFDHVGWLQAAAASPDTLRTLIAADASRDDQADKDLALYKAAESGEASGMTMLIAYGANPNADLKSLTMTHDGAGMILQGPGSGSVLIAAAHSGSPEALREVLKYHPALEARDREGKTAMFAAGDYLSSDKDGARVQCVQLLAEAGANVNAKDHDGNTPLHETFLTDVEEELLKSGADVNARNNDGETPIFTTVDDAAISLFVQHGADLKIRNKKGQTALEAAEQHGPLRVAALQKAIRQANERDAAR